jgi:hypothetical protein
MITPSADEAMFRLDAKLASYFATLKQGRAKGGSSQQQRRQLLDFKMRVAALLDAFCKRVGGVRCHLQLVLLSLLFVRAFQLSASSCYMSSDRNRIICSSC